MLVIASHNGLAAAAKACGLLLAGVPPLDAVVEGVALVEDDPEEQFPRPTALKKKTC